jgi:hypothetical protein
MFLNTIPAASGVWQPSFDQPVELPPDALRLAGCPTPSGLNIGDRASAYCGSEWRTGLITATGLTWVVVTTMRYGTQTVFDRRNLLVGGEAASHRRAMAKWRREHPAGGLS